MGDVPLPSLTIKVYLGHCNILLGSSKSTFKVYPAIKFGKSVAYQHDES